MLQRALLSISSQSEKDFVWVIVNDGGEASPVDGVAEQARQAGLYVTVIHHEKNIGMEAASNSGIRASNSSYVSIHDDDDTWEPEFLKVTARFLDEDKAHVGVVTHAMRVNERLRNDQTQILGKAPHAPILQAVQLADMARSNLFPPIAFLYRRSLFESVGGYDETMPVLGDWDFNLRALLQGDIAVIPKQLANYHVRKSNETGDPHYENSVPPQMSRQLIADAAYRNRKLREDMAAGRFGIGSLLMIGRLQARPSLMKSMRSQFKRWFAFSRGN
jgi:GT2 family glycosyltransferase